MSSKMDQGINLLRDERWDVRQENSFGYFQKIASAIEFNPQVPEDVISRFEVIKKLILHSYFVYDFLDVAMERALLTLELSLKIRYREIIGTKPPRKCSKLSHLIKWAGDTDLLENEESAVDNLRKLRNNIAHPRNYQLFGDLALHVIHPVAEVINGLYEDTDLRKARKIEEKTISLELNKLVRNGGELELKQDLRLIIFKACILYCNNKVTPKKFYFLFWPIFNPTPQNENVDICEPIIVCSNSWEIANDVFYLKNLDDGQEIRLRQITKNENTIKFVKWKQDFEASDFPLQSFINVRVGELRIKVRNAKDD